MTKWFAALATGAFLMAAASAAEPAKSDDLLSHLILSASGDSWNGQNVAPAVREDAEVKAGKASRLAVRKGANPWDVQASIGWPQPVQKGDILFVVYYARVETPPAGSATGIISPAGIQFTKPPYNSFASEPAAPAGKWGSYYVSGVADKDYSKGALALTLSLASAEQTLDLGPVFMFNLGQSWDLAKIPHNRTASAAAPAAPAAATAATPETAYAADLAKLRTKLPVKGTLISNPSQIYTYGPDITSQSITATDITGGKATRTITSKRAANAWEDGASAPLTGAIKKGDTVFAAVLVRATETPAGAGAGLIAEFGVKQTGAPYASVATASAAAPKGQWTWVFASAIAPADYAPGGASFSMQLGAAAQTLDVGPVIVLNLGPGVDPSKLPNNLASPF